MTRRKVLDSGASHKERATGAERKGLLAPFPSPVESDGCKSRGPVSTQPPRYVPPDQLQLVLVTSQGQQYVLATEPIFDSLVALKARNVPARLSRVAQDWLERQAEQPHHEQS